MKIYKVKISIYIVTKRVRDSINISANSSREAYEKVLILANNADASVVVSVDKNPKKAPLHEWF